MPTEFSVTLPLDYTVLRDILITWSLDDDNTIPLLGFELQRKNILEFKWETIITTSVENFAYNDKSPSAGEYQYRIRSIDVANNRSRYSTIRTIDVEPGVVTDANVFGADSVNVSSKDFAVPALDYVDALEGEVLSGSRAGNSILGDADGTTFGTNLCR